jgi:hypothetical protein
VRGLIEGDAEMILAVGNLAVLRCRLVCLRGSKANKTEQCCGDKSFLHMSSPCLKRSYIK